MHLDAFAIYRSIEHRDEQDSASGRVPTDDLIPYADAYEDPRRNVEVAKRIAA